MFAGCSSLLLSTLLASFCFLTLLFVSPDFASIVAVNQSSFRHLRASASFCPFLTFPLSHLLVPTEISPEICWSFFLNLVSLSFSLSLSSPCCHQSVDPVASLAFFLLTFCVLFLLRHILLFLFLRVMWGDQCSLCSSRFFSYSSSSLTWPVALCLFDALPTTNLLFFWVVEEIC